MQEYEPFSEVDFRQLTVFEQAMYGRFPASFMETVS